MARNNLCINTCAAVLFICLYIDSHAQISLAELKANFRTPPTSAKPRTWWHWGNSNITKEGITKDLEWMKRVGIQGMQLGDVAYGAGQTIEKKIIFRSPEWLDAVRHAAAEADRLGLEMAMFTSAGWSLTGGPWVKPGQAMKKLVWSETTIQGGKMFKGKLRQPPSIEGAGPNLQPVIENAPSGKFYADFAVIAYRTPADELLTKNPDRIITGAGSTLR